MANNSPTNTKRSKQSLHLQQFLQTRMAQQYVQIPRATAAFSPMSAFPVHLCSLEQQLAMMPLLHYQKQQPPRQMTSMPITTNGLLHLFIPDHKNRLKSRLSEMRQQRQLQHGLMTVAPNKRLAPLYQNNASVPLSLSQSQVNQQQTNKLINMIQHNDQLDFFALASSVYQASPLECSKPQSFSEMVPMSSWVISRAQTIVPEEHAQKKAKKFPVDMKNISRGSPSKDAHWRKMYQELLTYKQRNGSCTVPRGYPENPRLAFWVAEQRKQYKLMKVGRQSSITLERIELLDELGFAWNAQEAAWENHMRDLKAFRAEHGQTHCQLGDKKYPKLGLWIKEQRRHYNLMKQGKHSHMTDARRAELDSVGFCWDTHEATWLKRLNELREFKMANGNCNVPTNYPENPKLGTWIHHQRRQYNIYKEGKPCHITAERIRALNSLGFAWSPRDRNTSPDAITLSSAKASLTNLDFRPRKRQRVSRGTCGSCSVI